MLTAAYDGRESRYAPSLDYAIYRWRKEMGVGYHEAMQTPLDIIYTDLEYIGLERSIERAKNESSGGK